MVEIKNEFGYVIGVGVASWFLHHGYMAFKVMQARKKFEVHYPHLYATKDNCPNETNAAAFNCVQRGHQNSLENYPAYLAMLTMAGLQFPTTASAFGASYLLGRLFYFNGYASGDPKKRINPGTSLMMVGILGLVGTAIKAAVDLVRSK